MAFATYTKRLVPAGRFKMADNQVVSIDQNRLKDWAEKHAKLRAGGYFVPLPSSHYDDDNAPTKTKPDRHLDKVWLAGDGWLTGTMTAETQADADEIWSRKHVSIGTFKDFEGTQDVIAHVALTENPVVKGQGELLENKAKYDIALAFGNEDLVSEGVGNESEVTATVENAIEVLAELGLTLPDDTTDANIVERIVTAGNAVNAVKQESEDELNVDEAPAGAGVQEPSPIAMSKELDFVASLLSEQGVKNPATGKAFTATDLTEETATKPTVALSAEQNALVEFSRQSAIKSYEDRLREVVHSGRETKATVEAAANEHLPNLVIAFDENGKQKKQTLDYLLENWEARPKNIILGAHDQVEKVDGAFQLNLSKDEFKRFEIPEPVEFANVVMNKAKAKSIADEIIPV